MTMSRLVSSVALVALLALPALATAQGVVAVGYPTPLVVAPAPVVTASYYAPAVTTYSVPVVAAYTAPAARRPFAPLAPNPVTAGRAADRPSPRAGRNSPGGCGARRGRGPGASGPRP